MGDGFMYTRIQNGMNHNFVVLTQAELFDICHVKKHATVRPVLSCVMFWIEHRVGKVLQGVQYLQEHFLNTVELMNL